jgi:O-antigen/teichoic acid export membrane protein
MSTHISKNIFWLTLSRLVALILLFFAYTRLFPYLGVFGTGQYQFILSYVLLFSTVVDFGIQQFITKKISEQPEKAKEYFQNFFSFEVLVASALYLALMAIAFFSHYDRPVFFGVALAGLGMVAAALTYPYLAILASYQDLRKVALVNFINSLVNITFIFAAVIFHKYIVFLGSITFVFGIIDLIIYRFFVKKYLPDPQILKGLKKFNFNLVKDILRQGWPFALLVGFSAIYNRVDVIIITLLKGYSQTGLYTAAYKVFDLLNFFPAAVSYTLFPFFASLMAKGALGEVKANLEKYIRLMIILAVPMAVGGTILARQLILILTNHDTGFLPSGPVLAILIWAPAIQFIYIPLNSLIISQLTKKAMLITGINVVVNIAGNLILIPHYGIRAAAAMTVVSESLQGIFYFYFVKKNIVQFAFIKNLLKPLLAAAIMGVALWPLRQTSLAISLPAGLLVYGLVLVMSGFLSGADLQTIKQVFAKEPIAPAAN